MDSLLITLEIAHHASVWCLALGYGLEAYTKTAHLFRLHNRERHRHDGEGRQ